MDIVIICVVGLLLLSLGGWGYGYYSAPAQGASPLVNLLGFLALIFIVVLVVLLLTGRRFGLHVNVHPPGG